MLHLLVLLFLATDTGDLIRLKTFEEPQNDEFVSFPVAACFSPQGRLFVIDLGRLKIHIWEADGSYLKSFGSRGEGPGELTSPFQIVATADALYIWEDRRMISVFDLNGTFKRSFRTNNARPRVFGVLKPDLFLLGHKQEMEGHSAMIVSLVNGEGEHLSQLLNESNQGFIKVGEGDNNAYVKAYLPDLEIHSLPNDQWIYGFSQKKKLYRVDREGKLLEEKTFDLPTAMPTDEDKQVFGGMSFPSPNGTRIALKDLPNIRITYNYPKAYYTHFSIKDNRIAFVLTPIGSTDGTNTGYARATYYINDFKSGAILSKGAYALPEDSAVYYKNGRIIGCILNEDDDYEVAEVTLRGL